MQNHNFNSQQNHPLNNITNQPHLYMQQQPQMNNFCNPNFQSQNFCGFQQQQQTIQQNACQFQVQNQNMQPQFQGQENNMQFQQPSPFQQQPQQNFTTNFNQQPQFNMQMSSNFFNAPTQHQETDDEEDDHFDEDYIETQDEEFKYGADNSTDDEKGLFESCVPETNALQELQQEAQQQFNVDEYMRFREQIDHEQQQYSTMQDDDME